MKHMKKFLSLLFAFLFTATVFSPVITPDIFAPKAQAALAGSYDTGDLIYFGSYPQSEITNTVTKAILAEQEYDANGDFWYKGARYRRVKIGGITRFFLWEKITWRVLSNADDGLYILSENILDAKAYHNTNTSIVWANCTLRSWLNSVFYGQAFSDGERPSIRLSGIVNDNAWGTYGGADTKDYIFLPSYYDMISSKYGFSTNYSSNDQARRASSTPYAIAMGGSSGSSGYPANNGKASSWWWLRSPGSFTNHASNVNSFGYIYDRSTVTNTDGGVRPALKLNLNTSLSKADISSSPSAVSDTLELRVLDSAGNAISGATVKVKDSRNVWNTATTDSKGKVKFSGGGIGSTVFGKLELSVSKSGYVSFSSADGDLSVERDGAYTVVLYSDAEGQYKLKTALYESTDKNYNVKNNISSVNLLTGKKKLSKDNSNSKYEYFKITCISRNPLNTASYELYQGSTKIKSSANGVFDLRISEFSKGGDVYVSVCSKSGKKVNTYINLEITEEESVQDFQIKLGDKISFTVPKDTPYVGGHKIELDIPDLPVEVCIENGKAYVGLNVNLFSAASDDKPADPNDKRTPLEKQCAKIAKTMQELKEVSSFKLNSKLGKDIDAFMKSKEKSKFPGVGSVSAKFFGCGCYEWDDKDSELSVEAYLLLSASLEQEFNFTVVVVPVVVNIKLEASVKSNFKMSYNFTDKKFSGDIKLKPSVALTAFGGVGVSKWIGVGAYGKAELKSEIQLIGTSYNSPGLNSLDLTGELGLKAYAGAIVYTKDFAHRTWHLYSRAKTASLMPEYTNSAQSDMYNTDNYTLHDLTYLKNESNWGGNVIYPEFFDAPGDGVDVSRAYAPIDALLNSTYRNPMPVTVSNGNKAVMAFIGADEARGTENAAFARYSVFNGTGWTPPVAFDEDGTADTAPAVYAVNDDIYAAYQNTACVFNGDLSEDAYMAAQNITVARFDSTANEFTVEKTFTPSGSYYKSPLFTDVSGTPALVWLSCNGSDILGQAQSTDILVSYRTNSGWSDPVVFAGGLNSLSSIAAGEINGELAVAVCVDGDNSFATFDDRTVRIITSSGTVNVASADAYCFSFDCIPGSAEKTFNYIYNGALYSTADGTSVTAVTENIGSPESVEYLEDRIICTLADGDHSEIFSLQYDDNSGAFGLPVKLTEQDRYIERISAVTFNGSDVVTMTRKDVVISQGNVEDDCELAWMYLGERNDLMLENMYYSGSDVSLGKELPLYITVKNNGTSAISEVKIKIADSKRDIFDENITCSLLPGETKELEVAFPMEYCAEITEYTVSVADAEGAVDANIADNSDTFTVGYGDIVVSSEMYRVGEQNSMVVVVRNDGISPVGGVLDIYSDENELIPLASYQIEELGAFEKKTVYYDFAREDFSADTSVITCKFTSDAEEAYTVNNETTELLEFVDIVFDVCGVEIADGVSSLYEGETLALTPVIYPANADNTAVNWSTSNSSVLTVDDNGVVTAVSRGKATVTVTTADNDFTDTLEIAVLCAHDNSTVHTPPTCVKTGSDVYTCSKCGNVETVVIPATGHTTEKIPAVNATCIASGLAEGERCTVCGTITKSQAKVSPKGHDLALTRVVPAECLRSGTQYYTCNVCGFEELRYTEPLGHDLVRDASRCTAPTCISPGVDAYICSRCGVEDDAYREPSAHTPVTDAEIPAECSTPGRSEGSHCLICGYIITPQTLIPATGHNYEQTAPVAPTCTADGWTSGTRCTRCGTVAKEPQLIEAAGHSFTVTDCTSDTLCTVCGEVAVPAGEHTVVSADAVLPDCVNVGYSASEYCSVCGTVITAADIIPATDHDFAEETTAPTCVADGRTKYTCRTCGYSYTDVTAYHSGHNFILTVVNATCTENGTNTMRCSVCNEGYTAVIPAAGHKYFDIVVAPTCTENGYTRHICSSCGDEFYDAVAKATGHSYYKTVITPTCTQNGCDVTICSVCGYNFTDNVVEAPGHTMVAMEYLAPDCVDAGHTAGEICEVCNFVSSGCILLPAIGHIDADNDSLCDICGKDLTPPTPENCTHMCHSQNKIIRMFWNIGAFFMKIFGVKSVCVCGEPHV